MTPEDRALLAEADLLLQVAQYCDDPPIDDPWEGMPHPSPIAEGRAREAAALAAAIEAAVVVGLATPARAEELRALRERFDAAVAPPAVDPAARADLLDELERLLPAARRGLDDRAEDRRAAVVFDEIVQALELTGGLTEAEGVEWSRRTGFETDAGEAWERPPEPLQAVHAVLPGSPEWRDGARVLAVECYDGGVRVRWERRTSSDERPCEILSDARIEDDAGTAYDDCGGSGWGHQIAGGERLHFNERAFAPGVPAHARTLTVSLGAARFAFDVAGIGERPAT